MARPQLVRDPVIRFALRVWPRGDCWEWKGVKRPDGYGAVFIGHGRTTSAHRYSWELFIGPIPPGLVIDHLCGNRWCVRPSHLTVTTQRDNVLRSSTAFAAVNARKTHCPHGHPYAGTNLGRTRKGERVCRCCHRAKWHRWNRRRRSQMDLGSL